MVELELARLPFDVCVYAREIFKREKVTNTHLLQLFYSLFYLKDFSTSS